MAEIIRVVDGGGNGFRISDVEEGEFTPSRESRPQSLEELLDFVGSDLPPKLAGIAFAVTGLIEDNDRVVVGPNTPWLTDVMLGTATTAKTGIKTLVYNDMEAACIGMLELMPDLVGKRFVGITLSSGVGVRYVDEKGKVAHQGEAGHITVDRSEFAMTCGCGRTGCFETLLGGEALKRRVLYEASARKIEVPKDIHPCAFLEAEYKRGKFWATSIYDRYTDALQKFLTVLVLSYGTGNFVFRGSVARAMLDNIRNSTIAGVKDSLVHFIPPDICFRLCPIKNGDKNADTFLGGAKLFSDHLKK